MVLYYHQQSESAPHPKAPWEEWSTPAEGDYSSQASGATDANASASMLEELVLAPTRIIEKKLEVLVFEILERLNVRKHNLESLAADKEKMYQIFWKALYRQPSGQERSGFYKFLFGIEEQKRREDTQCWKDIFMVLRDLLGVWEANEHAKRKARLLFNASPPSNAKVEIYAD